MLVKFNQLLTTTVKSIAFNFDQETLGLGYADALQCKKTFPPSVRTSLPLTKTDIWAGTENKSEGNKMKSEIQSLCSLQ